jgi:hypothetical protein
MLATILSFNDVNATLVSTLAPRYGLLLIKLGMVYGDILSMLDTDLSKSLNVLTIVTPSNMPIHPSGLIFGQCAVAFDVEVLSSVDKVCH